jgi:hypothetical protein
MTIRHKAIYHLKRNKIQVVTNFLKKAWFLLSKKKRNKMYKPGEALYKALKGEPIDHREKLTAIGEGLVGLVLSMKVGSELFKPSEVSAAERISIEEYYRRAKPADEIIPGLRFKYFGDTGVNTPGFSLYGNEWFEAYNDQGEKGKRLRRIFKENDKKMITTNGIAFQFDFKKFNDYWVNFGNMVRFVDFRSGYMDWNVPNEKKYMFYR